VAEGGAATDLHSTVTTPLRAIDRTAAPPAPAETPLPWSSLLVAGSVLALLAAAALAGAPPARAVPADAELDRLLRAMALLKGLCLALALAALGWRFRRPVPTAVAAGYVGTAWAAAAALGAMWQQAVPVVTAVVLHGAAVVLVVLASRDSGFFPSGSNRKGGNG
jgi:peptidoglycan/LPS O-acetylase OafA/YrhL